MTPAEIMARFLSGEDIWRIDEAIRAPLAHDDHKGHAEAPDAEDVIRKDAQWQLETEMLARQEPARLAAALGALQEALDRAVDTDDFLAGFRAGRAYQAGCDSAAVGHLGNALIARAEGVVREKPEEPK